MIIWRRSRRLALRATIITYVTSASSSLLLLVLSVKRLCPLVSLVSQVVKLCCECLEKQENVLADTHLLKLRVLSVASEVLSYLRSFSEAAGYAHRMVEGYT